MRSTAKTLKQFISGFGLPAYASYTVPDDVQLPFLTYPLKEPEWGQKTNFYIQGWYRVTSYSDMLETCDAIVSAIGEGIKLDAENGYVVLYPETPLVQIEAGEDEYDDIRSFYISLSLNAYHMPGV